MAETFQLPVLYEGKQLHFDGELLQFGYVYKLQISVNGEYVVVEKDDEGNYRALLLNTELNSKIQKGLIKAIVEALEEILK